MWSSVAIFICVVSISLVNAQVIKQERVIYKDGEPISTEDIPVPPDQCWKYTWIGTYDSEAANETQTCNDIPGFLPSTDSDGIEIPRKPCWEPLVETYNNVNGMHGPNTTEIEEACRQSSCDPTCNRQGGEYCVSYIEVKDEKATDYPVQYATAYCGTGMVMPGGTPVKVGKNGGNKCYEQKVNDKWIRACFCTLHKCNQLNFFRGGLT